MGSLRGEFRIRSVILGPVAGFAIGDTQSFGDGSEIVLRPLVGNTILAVVATVLGYVVAYQLVVAYERRSHAILDTAVEEVIEELETTPDGQPPDDGDSE
jgi:hypothetical protein